jgi:SHS2 domain-containing protein
MSPIKILYSKLKLENVPKNQKIIISDDLKSIYYEYKNEFISLSDIKTHIYRRVNVNNIDDIINQDIIHTGIFWTLDKAISDSWKQNDIYDERFSKNVGKQKIIFESIIDINIVDINQTIRAWITSGESEITLIPNRNINIININNEQVRDKTFLT